MPESQGDLSGQTSLIIPSVPATSVPKNDNYA